jgi:hypothetical protein
MYRLLPVLASVVLLLAYGLAEGYWSDRWSLSPELALAPERLASVPLRVGEWEGEEGELDPRQARQGSIHASLLRRYTNRSTGDVLSVLLVCGRSGPIAVHSPEVCLGGSGFALQGKETRQSFPGSGLSGDDAFWVGRFHKPGAAIPEVMEVHWSWNARGDWQAVKGPRLFFARDRLLYKLYVTRAISRPDGPPSGGTEATAKERNPAHELLTVFLPEAKRSLFPEE